MKTSVSELEMEERTTGVPQKNIPAVTCEATNKVVKAKINSDISDLELQERTISSQRTIVHDVARESATKVVEAEINSDISDLELEERTISSQRKFVLNAHMEEVTPLDGRMFAASEAKVKSKNSTKNQNKGCCMAFLVVGASVLVSIWGVSKII